VDHQEAPPGLEAGFLRGQELVEGDGLVPGPEAAGERKSGMPDSVEMPAPVNTTARLARWTIAPVLLCVAQTRGDPMKYLHTMIRVSDLEQSVDFFINKLGFVEQRRHVNEKGRFTLVFVAAPESPDAPVELTYNWDPEEYTGGRNFGHLALGVDNIYDYCANLQKHGITINRPPRDGRMAFIKTPDGISIELLQKGDALPAAEPWTSMQNTGSW
jgi:lactoylglutathione lyase